jgi:hypothetical protein
MARPQAPLLAGVRIVCPGDADAEEGEAGEDRARGGGLQSLAAGEANREPVKPVCAIAQMPTARLVLR